MAKRYRPVDRDQRFLLPPDMREWLPADHLVWFLLEVVDRMDTTALHRRPRRREQGAATGSAAGRAGYDPDMLLGLLIYAYACGHQSSRGIERLCHTDVAFRVLCADDIPDHTVIARFRRDHQQVFTDLFAQVLRLCAAAGLGQVGTVAIDGSKFAANASKQANHERGWFAKAAEREAAERAAAAEQTDVAEDALFGDSRGDEVPPEYHDPRSRGPRIQECLDQIEAEDAARRAEAEARAARAADSVVRNEAALERVRAEQQAKIDRWQAARAAQAAHPTFSLKPSGPRPKPVDDAVLVRRAEQALARAHTKAARTAGPAPAPDPARESARESGPAGQPTAAEGRNDDLGKRPVRNLTDPDSRLMKTQHGWVQGYNAQFAISADQLVLATRVVQDPVDTASFVPMMGDAVAAATAMATARDPHTPVDQHGGIGLILADAGYPSDANLTAEGPDRLIALGKSRDQAHAARHRPAEGDPPPEASAREVMDHRLRTPDGHATYKRRGATVEPGIGNVKKLLDKISRRGLVAATSEITLAATVHNLLKLHRTATT